MRKGAAGEAGTPNDFLDGSIVLPSRLQRWSGGDHLRMSLAFYIAVRDAPEDLDMFVNGKAVSEHHCVVDRAAKTLGLA